MVCVVATPSSTRAASPVPQPPLDLGQTSFLDGEAGRGGLFEVIGNGYVAPQFTDASGGRVAGTNRQWIDTVILHLAYVSSVPVAGGSLGAGSPPCTWRCRACLKPPRGAGRCDYRAVHPMDKDAGLATALIDPAGYPGNGAYGTVFPKRSDQRGRERMAGFPYLAFTWRVSDRRVFRGRTIYDWSGQSGRPQASLGAANSQAGSQFAQNQSVSAAITDNWRLGVASYGLWQLDDTRVNRQAVPGSRQQVIAAGPGLLW
jgi:hypothetical protein